MDTVSKIPASETGRFVECETRKGQKYTISSCPAKERFTLWKRGETGYEKLCIAASPRELYDKIPWET